MIYAGTEPERVSALVCVDALGPPDSDPSNAPSRFALWLADLERLADRERPRLTLEEATARLHERFPRWSAEVARYMAEHATRPDGDRRVWKFDPLHQTTSPQPYYVAQARAFWRRVTCPVLYVEGAESGFRHDHAEMAARLEVLRARRVTVVGAAHHPHLERVEEFAAIVAGFLHDAVS
jgi:pimeloyl-ACP methyl ester carboxylesterase